MGAIDLIETVENILKGRPYSPSVKHVLLKKRIHTMVTEHPDRVERAVDFFTSKGLTSQEKSATLAVLDDIVDDEAYSTKIRGLWEREFEDEQRETPADDEAIDTQDWFVQWKKDLKNVDINEAIKSYRQ